MKKRATMVGAWCLTALLCVGCTKNPPAQSEDPTKEAVVYSNLVDATTQREVAQRLESHGITREQTDTLMEWANDLNSRVTAGVLAEGFRDMDADGVNYQGFTIDSKEGEDGWICPEANCRLTSYLLMKHLIHTNGTHPDNDTVLIFDLEAIDTYEPFRLTEEERGQFLSLFSWVPVDGADTLEEHTTRIQNAWEEREIQVEGEGVSLITVYLHLPYDEVRFVGHTGVLLETEEGLLFVEKYGPQFPFQATRFQNREELKQYLLGRADLYGDETELAPIILENDRLL